jgi:serine/threonine protein kinase
MPMTPDRWQQVEQICDAALARDASERTAFLEEACEGDAALRAEVESLLACEPATAFLDAPAMDVAARALANGAGGSLVGPEIGVYRIVSQLGVGRMGEVYRARDTKLGREVAIKILPAMFTADPERRARFDREARAVAALNHPHICTLHDVGEAPNPQPSDLHHSPPALTRFSAW